ncbi:MAG: hypothetical protein J6Q48_10590 [Bacteroidaceae bacterium]|nr:hypothetical protein [Bacteroidaceae bacterium]
MGMMTRRNIKRRVVANTTPVIEKESAVPGVEEVAYTKTEINRMPVADLKKMALDKGIADAENMSGADLKKSLIQKLGL